MSKGAWKKSIFAELSSTQPVAKSSGNVRSFRRSLSENAMTLNDDDDVQIVEVQDKTMKSKKLRHNWETDFAPKNCEELAVQPKKIEELHNWLQNCDMLAAQKHKAAAQLCLLTGPAGCGKTATLRVLAEQYQYEIQEWINPVDQDLLFGLGDQPTSVNMQTQMEAFKSFLLRASRYKSVLQKPKFNKHLLLVEDFPNMLLQDASTFEEILSEFIVYGKSPLIFICSDAKSRGLNISYNIFTDLLKQKYQIAHITFNSIASSLLHKAMKRFCSLMRAEKSLQTEYSVPAAAVVDSIVATAQGDIRNALLNLHFAALKGAPLVKLQRTESTDMNAHSKTKKRKAATLSLKSMGRNESITFLHSIGRVLNPKLNTNGKLTHDPAEVSEIFNTEPKRLLDFLQRNYLPHFSNLEHVGEAINALSLADCLLASDFQERFETTTIAADLAVRSLMVSNTTPNSGWYPVRGPTRWWENQSAVKTQGDFQAFTSQQTQRHSLALYAVDFASAIRIIQGVTEEMKLQ